MKYAILCTLNNNFLTHLFTDNLKENFSSSDITKAYKYDIKQIAIDVAESFKVEYEIVEVIDRQQEQTIMITLATLPQATEQQVFDQVSKHMLKQNERSLCDIVSGGCSYRNRLGLKCAAGCLIADSEYTERFEGIGWDNLVIDGDVPPLHVGLIIQLQEIHDNTKVPYWKNKLAELAKDRNLNFNA